MKQFNTIIRKEWQTHKYSFLIPILVVGGMAAIFGLISLYAYIRFGAAGFTLDGFPKLEPHLVEPIFWNLNVVIAGVIGIFCLTIINHLNETMLNSDHQKKCEILHSAQPCSALKVVAAKWSFSFFGLMLQNTLIIVLLSLVFSAFLGYLGYNVWLINLKAALSTLPMLLFASFVLGSGFWFFSCLFRRKSSTYSWIFVVGGHVLSLIAQKSWPQIKIPSPINFIINTISKIFVFVPAPGYSTFFSGKALSSQSLILHLLVASALYILGFYLYKEREIS